MCWPTISTSSSPSLGRCRPVATRMRILSRGMPACSSVSRTGRRISSLGTGRVMSQMTMHAAFRPAASSASGGVPLGVDRTRCKSSRGDRAMVQRPCRPATERPDRLAIRRPTQSRPYSKRTRMDHPCSLVSSSSAFLAFFFFFSEIFTTRTLGIPKTGSPSCQRSASCSFARRSALVRTFRDRQHTGADFQALVDRHVT